MKKSKSHKKHLEEQQPAIIKEIADDMSGKADLPGEFLVVGIGASAGGIQALKEFFGNVPADSGAAYVVILHLSPDHDSQLASVLQMVAAIPVAQVTEQIKVEPNRVYVVPPNEHLEMSGGNITVSPNTSVEERRAPVDIFFRTLAESHHGRAVAVVLSGTGANGSMGIKRIKERGGAAFVQNPREAEFSEMPRHSIATDLIDRILNVADIPAHIIAYKKSLGKIEIPVEAEERPEDMQQALREIFTQLRLRTGHDFSNYKRPTMLRRIERRINVFDLPDIQSYARFVRDNRDEANALLKDLLISVTNFFRDREAFAHLENDIMPKIFYGKTGEDQVRIWIAGCATGEEAYSIAMLCAERTFGLVDAPVVQIFATDIDEQAIQTARDGLYTLNDAADVSPERLRRFFTKEGDGYRVRRELRETILFANHNVLKDPPFSRLDAVTCRNMLIYLNQTAQERVMETFHFALNPGGFLFLGNSESVNGAGDLYAAVSKENHIFQSRQAASRIAYPVPETSHRFANMNSMAPRQTPPQLATTNEAIELSEENGRGQIQTLERISFGNLHQQLLELYAPPSIVVNEDYDIVHLSERAGRFLQIAGGEPTKNLLKLIRPELRLELRAALYQAVQKQSNVEIKNLKLRTDEGEETINIYARPVFANAELKTEDEKPNTKDQSAIRSPQSAIHLARGFVLVIFETAKNQQQENISDTLYTAQEPVARQLEEELLRTKSQLRHTGEQFEVQAEELKASNEELQALNEELRSAAEELETSKEELQSVNEELITVNQELKVKIEEVTQSSNDFSNLINSTDVATIFLDRSFRVHTFTPAASRIFNLIPADTGRPLADITHRLENDELLHDAERVLRTLQTIEREARTNDGRTYLLRVLPYRTKEDRINGVVATFLDITERKTAENLVLDSQARLQNSINIETVGVIFFNNNIEITECNDAFARMSGYTRQELKAGRFSWEAFTPEGFVEISQRAIEELNTIGTTTPYEKEYVRKDGSKFWAIFAAKRIGENEIVEFVTDITEQKRAEELVRESEEKYHTLFDSIDEGFCTIEVLFDNEGKAFNYRFLEANPAFARQTGLENAMGKTIREILPELEEFWFETYGKIVKTGKPTRFEHEAAAFGGVYDVYAFRIGEADENRLAVIFSDITERRRSEKELRESEERLRLATEAAEAYSWEFDIKTETYKFSANAPKVLGVARKNLPRTIEDALALVHPDDKLLIEKTLKSAIRTGEGFALDFRTVTQRGKTVWLTVQSTIVKDDAGKPARVIGIAQDITERRRTEEALRVSEERQRLLIESATDYAIFTLTRDGLIDSWNAGAEKVFGWTETEAVGKPGEIIFTPEDREQSAAEKEMEIALSTGSAPDERFHIRKDGSRFFVSGVMTLLKDPNGDVRGFTKIARDMSVQIEAERAVREKEMLQRLVGAQEDERRRIARDLHDELGQQLTALRLKLDVARKLCEKEVELCGKIDEIEQIARSIDNGVDFLAWELRPAALDHLGLIAALENYVGQWSHHSGVSAELLASKLKRARFAPETETNLYRIVQEALNNTHKHARAKRVEIALEKRGDLIVLIIEDDGIGFNPDDKKKRQKGMGLLGMAERAQLVGGELEIESAPKKGTTIYVRVPASPEKKEKLK